MRSSDFFICDVISFVSSQIYLKNRIFVNMEDKIWDPLRKKHVARTPEEEVRQWFISVMISGMKIPSHMMMSEVPIRFGDKDYRADIVAYGRDASPLMIVECKQPSVAIDQKVLDQAIRYNNVLNVKYIAITNGVKTFIFTKVGEKFEFMEKAPLWDEMICQQ